MAPSPSSRQLRSPPEEVSFVESLHWLRAVVPAAALALLAGGVLVRPPLLAGADGVWQPPSCRDSVPARHVPPATPAWYRLDAVLDARGTLSGQRLWLGEIGARTRRLELSPESFATGPHGSSVLVGEDDGIRSTLSLVDVAAGCTTRVAAERDVVRSALLAEDGAAVLEHRVDRVTRADLGVWRVPLLGGRATRIVDAAPADRTYGRTFTTDLRVSAGGSLAVTSCGAQACRTRIVDGASGEVTMVGPTGPVVGLAPDGTVFAHAACAGFPCAVLRAGPGGDRSMLVPEAGRATVAGDRLVFETLPAHGVAVLDLRDGSQHALDDATGLVPLSGGSGARAGAALRAGDVLLAPEGRLDPSTARVLGAVGVMPVPLAEVGR